MKTLTERLNASHQPGDVVLIGSNSNLRVMVSGIQREDGFYNVVVIETGERLVANLG